ncbi:conserved virulence factor C family protein [Desmospora activa]|nr:conserved virulence factor C family protein [Desmospora activa]
MNIISIEPTPSPNSMKINVDETVAQAITYTQDNREQAPTVIQAVLEIDGVKSVFRVADFLAVERNGRIDWKEILPRVREVFGEETVSSENATYDGSTKEAFGEIKVYVQTFRSLPIQVKLTNEEEERRFALPPRFAEAVMKAQSAAENMVMERRWEERGVRYGDWDEVGEEVVQEVSAAYDDERLAGLTELALNLQAGETPQEKSRGRKVTLAMMKESDWKKRYAALEQMNPTLEDLPVLNQALSDPKSSIRRLATAYLGAIEDKAVLPALYHALKDASVTVRRTAGDCLSDLGDPAAIPQMIEALTDKSKLVRWRAAMFLYETGDESAVPALRAAAEDPEFEVAMQAKMALERIERGEEAGGSVWRQMTNRHEHDSTK